MIPALLSGLLLASLAAADNARKGQHPEKMVAIILASLTLIALIFKFVPAESF